MAEKLSKKREEEIVNEVWDNYRYAMQAKKELHDKWRLYEEFYKNDQWRQIKVDKDRIKPTINYVFTTVESLMPYLTSNVPDPIVLPTHPEAEETATDLTKIVKIILNKNNIEKALQLGERQRLKFGTSIWKVFFDPTKLNGLGDVAFEVVDPVNFFIDPNEVDELQNADFCGTSVKRSIEYLRKRYPDKASQIQPDQLSSEISVYDSEDEEDPRNRQATLIEYWKKDKDNGLVRIVIAGDTLLRYDTNFYMHGKYPFVRSLNYPVQKSFWGMGEAEQLVEMQKILNKLLQIVVENVALANGQMLVDKNASGIRDIKSLANKLWQPGLTIPVNDVNSIKKLDGVIAPGWVVNLIQMLQKNIELVTGVSPLYLGEAPGSITAASGILALQEQATARVKLKLQEQGRLIEELVQFIIAYAVEFYTEDRYFRYLDERRQPQWIEMSQDDLAKRDEEGNLIIPEYDVSIEVGFDAPMSRAYIEQMAMQLFQMGVINSVEVLKTMNFPNKEEIIERLEQVSELQGQLAGLPQEMISPAMQGELAELTALDVGNPSLPGGMNIENTNSPQDAMEQQEQMAPEQLF
ncbi:hypothetical protein DCC39_10210 [Pueribacillus theae]|uniref:Phage portal protein n=2 Tax=Pueribacillus theae TaxID=2171751 RepID=A0A2U1K249_9BACI|nr:hypothetical protein DCC39_10210 [Pueribacillus theae]